MLRAFVLMTALPPTKGHLHLIQFANALSLNTTVLVCTQPSEPYHYLRSSAIAQACKDMPNVTVRHLHQELEQNPEIDGFWPMWVKIMQNHGFEEGDMVVTSEPYGQTLADLCGGIFIPYDLDRKLYYTKATRVRENPAKYFVDVLPEFQKYLRQTVTLFGAESTGKTSLSHQLSIDLNSHWLFEYARPYLEQVGAELSTAKMRAIWRGQRALQDHTRTWLDKPWVIQDTDLFSTVGYWQMYTDRFSAVPDQLTHEALVRKSDLYIVCPSNIPFEENELRYGGPVRESNDSYWTNLLDKYSLNYHVLTETTWDGRLREAKSLMNNYFTDATEALSYDRKGY